MIAIPPAVMSSDGAQIWPGKVTIRQTYVDFTGTFVLHCHILAHEDRGMMELVRVVPEPQTIRWAAKVTFNNITERCPQAGRGGGS